ncbi:hypothetical protein Syun_028831 [Stephania yunnanensis]|uniref:Uncharacterized protein n=1 Tax=Stephania yunnanensis TaxID=152371 RepID=A0AAP0E7T9_9MAGN
MADSESAPTPPAPAPLSPSKENVTPYGSRIAVMPPRRRIVVLFELSASRTELMTRIQGLKQVLVEKWFHLFGFAGLEFEDTETEEVDDKYGEMGDIHSSLSDNELTDLKKSLNVEVEQLRSEFQELKSTLQQQQEDVTNSLKNLGLQDLSEDPKVAPTNVTKEDSVEVPIPAAEDDNIDKEVHHGIRQRRIEFSKKTILLLTWI